jgi:hypothetical protein
MKNALSRGRSRLHVAAGMTAIWINPIWRLRRMSEVEAMVGAADTLVEVIKLETKKLYLLREYCLSLAYHKKINTVAAFMELPAGVRGQLPLYMKDYFIEWYKAGGFADLGHSECRNLKNNKHLLAKYVEGVI